MRGRMWSAVILACLVSASGCSLWQRSDAARDPVAIGRALGALSCAVAVAEKPEIAEGLAQALAATKVVLESADPTMAAIAVGLSQVSDPRARTYASSVIAVVLALFPSLPEDANAAIPVDAKDALLAAIAACEPLLVATLV